MTALLVFVLMGVTVSFLVAREFIYAHRELHPAIPLRALNAEYKALCEGDRR
jgi:hypothetical protein